MENENNPQEIELTSEKVVKAILVLVFILSGLASLYSLIWANWPVFQFSVTIFVSMIIAGVFGYLLVQFFKDNSKK